jgi:hypothetical protein
MRRTLMSSGEIFKCDKIENCDFENGRNDL